MASLLLNGYQLCGLIETYRNEAKRKADDYAHGLSVNVDCMEGVEPGSQKWNTLESMQKKIAARFRHTVGAVAVYELAYAVMRMYAHDAKGEPIDVDAMGDIDAYFVSQMDAFFDVAERIARSAGGHCDENVAVPTHRVILAARRFLRELVAKAGGEPRGDTD